VYLPFEENKDAAEPNVKIFVGPIHKNYINWEEAISESYEAIAVGDSFSPASITSDGVKEFPWTQRWFRVDVQVARSSACYIDDESKGLDRMQTDGEACHEYCLHFLAHGEFTVYTNEGNVWCGIDPCHSHIPLSGLLQRDNEKQGMESCTLWLDGGQWQTGFWFGLQPPTDELGFRILKFQLQTKNSVVNEVYHDLSMLIEWVEHMYEKEGISLNTENGYYEPLEVVPPLLRRVLHLLNLSCDCYDQTQCLTDLKEKLRSIYQDCTTSESYMQICLVGHAHMDLVWLWPERVTYKKIIHSYSNVLQLMNKYPQFTFTMSQPPLYFHIREKQPDLAARIEEKVKGGQWEFTGALEVEADTQIPVGEGLIRCILYGQERIKALRGSVSDTVWIPDVFGYSQCLPQIFYLAEIPNFFTTKILWSTITKFPHNSFVWTGPDGESEVLAHLGVAGYSGKVSLKEVIIGGRNYKQADVHNEVLCPSGYGDGGGGPSEDQIERSLRLQTSFAGDLSPACKWGTSDSFFKRLASVKDELPIYRGELFLEYHRAVHTTQSDFKKNLRNCERALQTREAMRVISANYTPLNMRENWERYLFALFHDATPGSSIHSVYKELNAELTLLAERQFQSAFDEWPRQSEENTVTIVNPLAWKRHGIVEIPEELYSKDNSGQYLCATSEEAFYPIQVVCGRAYSCIKMQGLTATPFITNHSKRPKLSLPRNSMTATPTSLGNGIVHAEFDPYGQVKTISIRGKPLLISKHDTASFTLHRDHPEAFDAWDMDHHIVWMKQDAISSPVSLQVIANGPVLAMLQSMPISIGENGSTLVIQYSLHSQQHCLSVKCIVDWKECHKALRFQIPTSYCGDVARFGGPFNFVDRAQTPSRQKEEAQWEVPASRWASILDGSLTDGLSIVTESKYGFRAKQGILSLTLLRSPTVPDPKADQGSHTIEFAIARHQNMFCNTADNVPTAAMADELFTPFVVLPSQSCKAVTVPPITFATLGSVVPSWVLPSYSTTSFCVRLHETAGAASNIAFSVRSNACVQTINFNEKVLSVLERASRRDGENYYEMEVSAYKIVTLRILFDSINE